MNKRVDGLIEEKNDNVFYFNKGRVALHAILGGLDIKKDDEIIVPAFTCVVVPNAMLYRGAKPVYVDIQKDTFNVDPCLIENKINDRTKAIIAQHTYGIPAEMDNIMDIAEKYGIFVIEDSCHSIGSKYRGKETGSFGDAAFYSSQWSKPVSTGLGGWAIINNAEIIERMKDIYAGYSEPSISNNLILRIQYLLYKMLFKPSLFWSLQEIYRRLSDIGIAVGSSSSDELSSLMPSNYEKKMARWQISLLSGKLSKIDPLIMHRRKISLLYETLLPSINIKSVSLPDYYDPVYLRYPVLVKDKEKVLMAAKRNRIEIGDWFVSPVHPNRDGWEKVNYQKGNCPAAEDVCRHVINLPTHDAIDENEVKKIINFLGNV